jgi:hypothetical protein
LKESHDGSRYTTEKNVAKDAQDISLFEGNSGVIVNNKSVMKGSATTRPVSKNVPLSGLGLHPTLAAWHNSFLLYNSKKLQIKNKKIH